MACVCRTERPAVAAGLLRAVGLVLDASAVVACTKRHSFGGGLYVCPEPVLVK
jgi:hypothetical protein